MSSVVEVVESARKSLKIKQIYLANSFIQTAEDLDRRLVNMNDHICQYFSGCDKLSVFRLEDNEPTEIEDQRYWYKFTYSAGVRLLREHVESDDVPDENVLAVLNATFDVFYASAIEVEEESTNEFAARNVQYHVWPFWREFVHSACGRIGLAPPIEIPSYLGASGAK